MSLKHRLKRLEAAAPRPGTLLVTVPEWDRLPPERRQALLDDPGLEVIVVETGIRREGEPPCA